MRLSPQRKQWLRDLKDKEQLQVQGDPWRGTGQAKGTAKDGSEGEKQGLRATMAKGHTTIMASKASSPCLASPADHPGRDRDR